VIFVTLHANIIAIVGFLEMLHANIIAVAQTVLTATQLENSLGAIYLHYAVKNNTLGATYLYYVKKNSHAICKIHMAWLYLC